MIATVILFLIAAIMVVLTIVWAVFGIVLCGKIVAVVGIAFIILVGFPVMLREFILVWTVTTGSRNTGYIKARQEFMQEMFHVQEYRQKRDIEELPEECSVLDFMVKYYNMPVNDSTKEALEKLLDATQRFTAIIPFSGYYEAKSLFPQFRVVESATHGCGFTFDEETIKELIDKIG